MSSFLNDLLLSTMTVRFSEDLMCSRFTGDKPMWLISHKENRTPHAVIKLDNGGNVLVESRWQLGMVWREDCLILSHDSHQRGSFFEEDLKCSETSKASLVYRLGE